MHLKLPIILAVSVAIAGAAQARGSKKLPEFNYICNSARVSPASGKASIPVRARDAKRAPIVDKVSKGKIVFVCDGSTGWVNIFYSSDRAKCAGSEADGLRSQDSKSCKRGWIPERDVDIISG